ncbi:lysophosphatidic acid receptor 6-like [Osmerus mordax]|uniref:lysophosphatidic acid receptor 6-like n=1 Tax=Osmerus mordax TaxID=8014 RepID=UPI00350F2DFA
MICNVITAIFGFPASVAVLWELFQKHRRGTPTTPNDVFMLNLTVMDMIFLFFLPMEVCNYVIFKNWKIQFFCNFLNAFNVSGRPLFMTCICLDCYLAVVHPIMYRARRGLTSRVLMCVVVWAVTLATGVVYSLFNMELGNNPITVMPFVVAILITGICDFFILRALKSSDPAGRKLHPQKKKALQIIINSLVMTLLAYLPQVFLFIGERLTMTTAFYKCVLYVPFLIITASSAAVMPVLYLSDLGKLDRVWLWCHKTT